MHHCPCALTFPTLSDLRFHQDRCAKFASIIKLPSQTPTRLKTKNANATSSRSTERGNISAFNTNNNPRENEVYDFSHTPRLTARSKQTGRNKTTDRGDLYDSGASQRKRTSLTVTKKTSTPQASMFATARISPQNPSKASSSKQKREVGGQTAFTTDSASASGTKSTSGSLLLWQQLDQEQAIHQKGKIKSGRNNFLASGRMRGLRKVIRDEISITDPTHLRANISPKLRLVVNGVEESASDSDDTAQLQPRETKLGAQAGSPEDNEPDAPLDVPMANPPYVTEVVGTEDESDGPATDSQPESPPSPIVPVLTKRKAARKLYSFYASDSGSELEAQDSDLEVLEARPRVSLSDPNSRRASATPAYGGRGGDEEPGVSLTNQSESIQGIKAAVQSLTLPTIRMHATKQLPFLKRNLAAGFLGRCQQAHVPIYADNRPFSLTFRYEHMDGIFYETTADGYSCPLCRLLGAFQTREMLQCHLTWDHPEIVHEWHAEEKQNLTLWKLRVLIPETMDQKEHDDGLVVNNSPDEQENSEPATPIISAGRRAYDLSILPYVALSPPQSPELGQSSDQEVSQTTTPPIHKKEELHEPSVTLSLSRSAPSPHQSSLVSSLPEKQVTYRSELPPPNPDNPLGPAARYPYLPAKSEYGGPMVLYSCRPGGPCLYDLLGTLPLEPYGLLSWEVIDREEEIYESDDIKEEYKIMHALWARWIILNRTKFVSNYAKGVSDFVDYYWKFIYLASGWDGLRYWLLMLHANRFLTPAEVAKTLNRYENLTGMSDF